MTAKRIALALTLAGVLATPATSLRAQSSEELTTAQTSQQGGILDVVERTRQAQAQAQQLEGSWAYTVTPAVPPGVSQPPPQRAYVTLARGGALTGYVRNAPGGPHYGPHHGVALPTTKFLQ